MYYFRLLFNLINVIGVTVGLYKLLPKCDIDKKVAFIPFYRIYALARVAGSEDAGLAWLLASICSYCSDGTFGCNVSS